MFDNKCAVILFMLQNVYKKIKMLIIFYVSKLF